MSNTTSEKFDDIEGRVHRLEIAIAMWKGAFVVAAVAVLALLGITSFVGVPRAVEGQLQSIAGKETLARISQLDNQLKSIMDEEDLAAHRLGLAATIRAMKPLHEPTPTVSLEKLDVSNREWICPPGTYMVGITAQADPGGPRGIISRVMPIYRKFPAPAAEVK